ncbi:unnamed protein product [Rhizoctonia solani]|uniref:O-methylsterigmatocystin oxidoreductase n=1 Tax=Rhizoctonia solani TaxID=456999 RepID=A0A8H3CKL0_9AGAM|nr:unnamed protein product [Rhizoctonia solani]
MTFIYSNSNLIPIANDVVNIRTLGYIVLTTSIVVAVIALAFKLNRKEGQTAQAPPTIPWKWFSKGKQLVGAPYRGILIAEKYKPLYGDIIQLSEPFKQRVMLNSFEVISEALDKQSGSTSDRPRNVMLVEMTGIDSSVAFRNHDEKHKKLRRIIASGLHPVAARSYSDMHMSTTAFFLLDIFNRTTQQSESAHDVIDMKLPDANYHSEALLASIQDSIGRFIMRMTFGYIVKENDPVLKRQSALAQDLISNFGTHFWVNDFPILRYIPSWFPGAGFKRYAKRMYSMRQKTVQETFEAVLSQALRGDILPASYASNLIELKGGRNISEDDTELVRWTSNSMFAAGSTTTTALVNSFIFAMSIRSEIASKVQAEIDAQIGRDRIPTLHDRSVLPYTDAVLQEVIRFYPVFPLGLEHVASEEIEVRGYKIKKGTILEGNIWAIMHDPTLYLDPYTFNPERYLKERPETDPRRFLFGFGRRVCPGQHVANNGAFVMGAAFLSVFNISASEETMKKAESCANEPWKMFKAYGAMEPMPFGCTVSVRDKAAASVLETCKETSIMT